MSFLPGFASRHDAAAAALGAAFALPAAFETRDLTARPKPRGFAPQGEAGPRHFAPRDPDANPTEGWDPLDPSLDQAGDPKGFVDPVAAAHAAGHAEGYAAALAEAAADAGRDAALAAALGTALGQGIAFDRDRIARQMRQTVLLLVARLVGDVGVSAELLAGRIESAVDILADSAESALLRLHPDDVALVEGRLPKTLFPVGDAAIARGSFVLESASTIVEDGPDQWLAQLTAAIDRVAVPAC
ncbi:flagellar assembly protein FliH [Sphingomonas donggukensis]|uniref:Flagellar assembly protein FliH n=1 Tax=Sphingomonas donggukensis TaxID=2949093 RepID=A0ABY4TV11_9SPHN|nr:FliH/SctL family protein [Sphingomonas donggukensis]URW75556.1 flagellar assembly protein FliH [Sphingomonas donggukensis]